MQIDETIDAIELYYAQGWTDGLPVVPPTRPKVQAMVERSGRAASEVIAELPPQGGKATVERIATNAVMAGCLVVQRADAVVERIIEQLMTTH